MHSWHSITCSTASPGSSRVSSCTPSGCVPTSRRATASSSASASCSPSSSRGSRERRPTGSCRRTRCARGTRGSTSWSWFAATGRSPAGSISTPPSTSARTRGTWTSSSSGSTVSRRSRYMPETAAHLGSGKVRELYALDDERLLLVASDRISTFDVVLPTEIPDKGRLLTGLSAFWFTRTSSIVPNHLLGLREDGRSTECRRLRMLPIECVVRGYLSGSGWKDYRATGEVCGHELPEGLGESERLPEPIFTPATKAQT